MYHSFSSVFWLVSAPSFTVLVHSHLHYFQPQQAAVLSEKALKIHYLLSTDLQGKLADEHSGAFSSERDRHFLHESVESYKENKH